MGKFIFTNACRETIFGFIVKRYSNFDELFKSKSYMDIPMSNKQRRMDMNTWRHYVFKYAFDTEINVHGLKVHKTYLVYELNGANYCVSMDNSCYIDGEFSVVKTHADYIRMYEDSFVILIMEKKEVDEDFIEKAKNLNLIIL